ncbi:MAG: hypothetical protein AB7G93_22905, partial [Bdellovibrionales bacterium]
VSKAEFWAHLGPIRISTGNSAQKIMKNMNLVNNANLNFGFGFENPTGRHQRRPDRKMDEEFESATAAKADATKICCDPI